MGRRYQRDCQSTVSSTSSIVVARSSPGSTARRRQPSGRHAPTVPTTGPFRDSSHFTTIDWNRSVADKPTVFGRWCRACIPGTLLPVS